MSVAQYNSAIKMSGIAMKLADKDYDKDGVVEDSTKEYLDSRSNAIKENKKNN